MLAEKADFIHSEIKPLLNGYKNGKMFLCKLQKNHAVILWLLLSCISSQIIVK